MTSCLADPQGTRSNYLSHQQREIANRLSLNSALVNARGEKAKSNGWQQPGGGRGEERRSSSSSSQRWKEKWIRKGWKKSRKRQLRRSCRENTVCGIFKYSHSHIRGDGSHQTDTGLMLLKGFLVCNLKINLHCWWNWCPFLFWSHLEPPFLICCFFQLSAKAVFKGWGMAHGSCPGSCSLCSCNTFLAWRNLQGV